MRYFIQIILPFLAIFLQTTLFRSYTLFGSIPDVLLILVIFYALFNGARKGTTYGVLCGLLEDLYVGHFIGINAIGKGITAYVIGRLQGNVFKENPAVGIIGVVGGTSLNSVVLIIIYLISAKGFDESILLGTLYQIIYNTMISIPMYIWYYRSSNHGLLREMVER